MSKIVPLWLSLHVALSRGGLPEIPTSASGDAVSGCAAAILSVRASLPWRLRTAVPPLETLWNVVVGGFISRYLPSQRFLNYNKNYKPVLRQPKGRCTRNRRREQRSGGDMSSEESYLAIIRYLTDEREPYAPGTPGNTKRKIRKAATCYVVRDGTLFYQRRLKGQDDFTELQVVLQDGRRTELINEAHTVTEGGEHLNQQLTWDTISRKYWWRGGWLGGGSY